MPEVKSLEKLELERAKLIDKMEALRSERFKLDEKITEIRHDAMVGKYYKDWCDDGKHTFYKPSFDKYTRVLTANKNGTLKVLKFREFERGIFDISIEIVRDVRGKEITRVEFDKVFNPLYYKLCEVLEGEG